MDLSHLRRARALILLFLFTFVSSYEIPDVEIVATPPKGFKASIPAEPGINYFVFHGNVNTGIKYTHVGTINGEVMADQKQSDRYTVYVPDAQLKVGDVIRYYVYVSKDKMGYLKDNLNFTVRETNATIDYPVDPFPKTNDSLSSINHTVGFTSDINDLILNGTVPGFVNGSGEVITATKPSDCRPTATKVRGGKACSGYTIFEENFDNINENVWQIEHHIPYEHPEFPFVSYQRVDSIVKTSDGKLQITPKLLQDLPGYTNDSVTSGVLDLVKGCTGSAIECTTYASGASILPPVVSGRIMTKEFAFTYGTIEVRAKLPKGDWLYPEILLEPFIKKYGRLQYAGGVLKIATARGNAILDDGIKEYGNKILYGGAIMDFKCRTQLIREFKSPVGRSWGDDYHIYSMKWTPEDIALLVDGVEWARIEPSYNGLVGQFPQACDDLPREFLNVGSKMAPFDDFFYITLGVAAGGITEFPDGVSGLHIKPWRNSGRKASLNFWQAQAAWYPTWRDAGLAVDYVKVYAL